LLALDALLNEIRDCRACAGEFSHEPRPVIQASATSRLLICGQAPGRRVHESGLPFDDASGDRLRDWIGVDRDTFYSHPAIAVVPMAFCYPGTAPTGGDYPPPRRCAERWRARLTTAMLAPELILAVGGYAQRWLLGKAARESMTATVAAWPQYGTGLIPLPHPSWRNSAWLRRNRWFE
jgi:uracil-DNA glycosylase